ncbi:MAG: hypothetical protein AAF280_01785 [Pseudomonadota bacterium]
MPKITCALLSQPPRHGYTGDIKTVDGLMAVPLETSRSEIDPVKQKRMGRITDQAALHHRAENRI